MNEMKNLKRSVLLVGNPNTGKTSLINRATKSALHIGNWHGVTVGATARRLAVGGSVDTLIDLPGTYSLCPYSLEENITAEYVATKNMPVLNICEQNNLRRNLLLTLQLLELGIPTAVLVNRFGKTQNAPTIFNEQTLSKTLGATFHTIDFFSKNEIENFFKSYNVNLENQKYNLPYLKDFPLEKLKKIIIENDLLNSFFPQNLIKENKEKLLNFIAMRALEKDEKTIEKLKQNKDIMTLLNACDYPSKLYTARYDYIDFLLKKCNYNLQKTEQEKHNSAQNSQKIPQKTQKSAFFLRFLRKNKLTKEKGVIRLSKKTQETTTEKLDKILLNKYLALPIFAVIMLAVFYLTFSSVGAFISGIFEFVIVEIIGAPLRFFIEQKIGTGFIYSLVANGIIGGVGSVVSFLPQVILLFLFLTILEESGYMARLAYLMEGVFNKVGLSGKSVFTFLMGFGCTATAIMTAQNLNNKNEKIKTVLTTPFMACSAKLPVFAVIGGAFFANGNVFVIFLMYILSALLGILLAKIFDKTRLKNTDSSFILEFPPYRKPTARTLLSSVWRNTKEFLTRIGGYIFFFSIIIWLLQSFTPSFEFIGENDAQNNEKTSILQSIAQILAPLFAPLGFGEWGAVSALIAGLIAKELIVSSIGIINNVSATNELVGASLLLPTSVIYFTPASALSFLTFCLLYTPCIATISVMRAEIGAKWTTISVAMQLIVAYIGAYFVYKITSIILLYGWLVGIIVLLAICLICYAVAKSINYFSHPAPCTHCQNKNVCRFKTSNPQKLALDSRYQCNNTKRIKNRKKH